MCDCKTHVYTKDTYVSFSCICAQENHMHVFLVHMCLSFLCICVIASYSLLHLECRLISFSNLNLIGVSFQRKVAKETQRTRLSIEN